MLVDLSKLNTVSVIREFTSNGSINELFCHVFYFEEQ